VIKTQNENMTYGSGGDVVGQLATAGGSVQIDTSPYNDAYRSVYRSLASYGTAGSYYLSGLVSAPDDSNGEALMGLIGPTSSVRWGFVGEKATMRLGEVPAGTGKPTGGSDHVFSATTFTPDKPALFVLKIDVDNAGNDTASLWFNPAQYSSEAVAGPPSIVANSEDFWNNATLAGELLISNQNFAAAGVSKYDEARFGTTWGDVVPQADVKIEHLGFQEDVLPTATYTHLGCELREGAPTEHHSTDPNIRVGYHTASTILSMRPVLAFDLSELNPNNAIDEVTLRMTIDSWSGSNLGDVKLYAVLPGDLGEQMVESQTSWNDRNSADPWTTPGGDFYPTALSTVSGLNSTVYPAESEVVFESTANLVAATQAALDAGRPLELIMLAPDVEGGTSNHFVRWRSDDWGSSLEQMMTRPLLSVSYVVPEPSSILLAAIGLLALVGYTWRCRST